MATVTKLHPINIEEYLQGEQKSDIRHEYINGEIFAMVGASKRHNLITGTLYSLIRGHLSANYNVYFSDVKVRIDSIFYYPDLLVSCSENENPYYETDPILIIEVLSPSTEAKDRFEKRLAYQNIESLKEYVTVAQDKLAVDIYRRMDDGNWAVEQCSVTDNIRFESIELETLIDNIYRDVMRLP